MLTLEENLSLLQQQFAHWDYEYGVRHQRKFWVLKYSEYKAKQLAMIERKRHLQESVRSNEARK